MHFRYIYILSALLKLAKGGYLHKMKMLKFIINIKKLK